MKIILRNKYIMNIYSFTKKKEFNFKTNKVTDFIYATGYCNDLYKQYHKFTIVITKDEFIKRLINN